MVPKVIVMSRLKFEEYIAKNHNKSSLAISITSHDEMPVTCQGVAYGIKNGIKCTYRAEFDDVDNSIKGMSTEQALEIARFIKANARKVDTIIVHCGAGQSRSAGVAAAILKWMTGSDAQIFDNKKYTPNMRCYRLVLEALMIGG